jgi:hypothetical protein
MVHGKNSFLKYIRKALYCPVLSYPTKVGGNEGFRTAPRISPVRGNIRQATHILRHGQRRVTTMRGAA